VDWTAIVEPQVEDWIDYQHRVKIRRRPKKGERMER
jgi:hypothetical protein